MFFNDKKEKENTLYASIRDDKRNLLIKNQIEQYWKIYECYAPKSFLKKAQQEDSFKSRWWEMYCGVALLGLDIKLKKSKHDAGPDFKFENNNQKYYIEAIAPTQGDFNSKDRLPDIEISEPGKVEVYTLPINEFMFRLSGAVKEKIERYNYYIEKNIVNKNDILIIGLSACNLSQYGSLMDEPVPAILKVLFGKRDLTINLKSGNMDFTDRYAIKKSSGNEVETCWFLSDESKIISAILYSNSDILNSPQNPCDDLLLIKNPNANVRVNDEDFKGVRIIDIEKSSASLKLV